jgi:predicted Zn finger-like uncharacterized protein
MIIQCQSCSSKYFLPEEKVPVNPLKVRCPKCRAVFMLAARAEKASLAAAPAPVVEAAAPSAEMPRQARKFAGRDHHFAAVATEPALVDPVMEAEAAPVAAAVQETPATVMPAETIPAAVVEPAMPETPAAAPDVEPAAAPAPRTSQRGGKSADDRAKRLARVLVSDILWYNRERRDAALRDGTLMTSLGEEIKKSWELYKEKVGPEAAHSTNYFKEALNEILANGQQVF